MCKRYYFMIYDIRKTKQRNIWIVIEETLLLHQKMEEILQPLLLLLLYVKFCS